MLDPDYFPCPMSYKNYTKMMYTNETPEAEYGTNNLDDANNVQGNVKALLPRNFTEISPINRDCILVYTILFVLAAVGNLLVLYCVQRYGRNGKSRTPLLITNLCVADLFVTFFLLPTEIVWRITIAWKGGDLLCKVLQFLRAFGMYLSSNVVMCISIDRYFAIVYPFKLAGAIRRIKRMLIVAWVGAAFCALPQVFVYHVASHPDYPEFRQCVTKAFISAKPYNELFYNIFSVTALYFLPLLIIMFSYGSILWKIHRKTKEHLKGSMQNLMQNESPPFQDNASNSQYAPPNTAQSQHEVLKYNLQNTTNRTSCKRTRLILRSCANQTAALARARSRTLRLSLLILIVFVFCWTPYVWMTIWYMVDRHSASQVDERIQETVFLLCIANSVLDPIIYGTVGRKQDFQKWLSTLCHSITGNGNVRGPCCCYHLFLLCCRPKQRRNSDITLVTMEKTHLMRARRRSSVYENNTFYPRDHAKELSPQRPKVTLKTLHLRDTKTSLASSTFRRLTGASFERTEVIYEVRCVNETEAQQCTECAFGNTVLSPKTTVNK